MLIIVIGLAVKTLFNAQSYFYREVTNSMCTTGILGLLFEKMHLIENKQIHQLNIGKISNEITNDLRRASFVSKSQMRAFIMPVIVLIFITILISQFGAPVLVGIGIIGINFAILSFLGNWIARLNKEKLENTDMRNKEIAMGLKGIKTIKLNCWEELLMKRVNHFRANEESLIFKQTLLRIAMEIVGFVLPCIAALITIVILKSSRQLLLGDALYIISIFHCVVAPIKQFGDGYTRLKQAIISFERLQHIADLPEEAKLKPEELASTSRGQIELVNFTTGLKVMANGQKTLKLFLKNQNLKVDRGNLVVIHGKAFSGKSMFLRGLLDNLEIISGSKSVSGSICYMPQTTFIMKDSIRKNVTFGKEFDLIKYHHCLRLSQIAADLEQIKGGDLALVEENGFNLSEGQKQRISLARALYQDSDIYLMDDVLSAIDNRLSKRIFQDAIVNHLRANKKTVLICSNDLGLLKSADIIVEIKDEYIAVDYKTLVKTIEIHSEQSVKGGNLNNSFLSDDCAAFEVKSQNKEARVKWNFLSENLSKQMKEDSDKSSKKKHGGKLQESRDTLDVTNEISLVSKEKAARQRRNPIEKSKVSISNMMMSYFSNGFLSTFVCVLTSTFSLILLKLLLDYFLGLWVTFDVRKAYLIISIFLIFVLFGIGLFRALMISDFFTQTSVNVFENFIKRVLGKSIRFFNRTSSGKFLNLASKDIDTIDLIYPQQVAVILFCGVQLIVICSSVVLHCVPLVLLVAAFFYVLYRLICFYISVSQDLVRVELASYSPLISCIIEAYNGILVFRHSDAVSRQRKIFTNRVNQRGKVFMNTARITAFIQMLCEAATCVFIGVVFSVLVFVSLQNESISKSEVTLLSVKLNWIFVIPSFMNVLLIYYSFFCQAMVSSERIFKIIPKEDSDIDWSNQKLLDLNFKGNIEFRDYSFRYNPQAKLALKNINLKIEPRQKVGIVGQTGSGKSTMLLALSQMMRRTSKTDSILGASAETGVSEQIGCESGRILVDGVDLESFRERNVRYSLGIIDQNNFIFQGSLRQNLDPLNSFSRAQLAKIVFSMGIISQRDIESIIGRVIQEQSPVSSFTPKELNDILEFPIKEEGKNISLGQKQMICIARVILKQPKVLFIDEGTSNIDSEKSEDIMNLLQKELPNSTMVSIAHRIDTLKTCDKIFVMDKGEIVEEGSYTELLELKNHFWTLVNAKNSN